MKKVIIVAIIGFLFIINHVIDITTNKLAPLNDTYFSKVEDKDFYISKDGKWKNIDLIGVNLTSSKPGYFPSEYKVEEEEYLRYLSYIYQMGANCIKVPNLMGHEFYDALEKFNKDKEEPMYLIQGVYFDEVLLKDGYDAKSAKLEDLYKENIKYIVDSVHGNPLNSNNIDLSNQYKIDISDYVIGYTLGIEFGSNDIIYTEIINKENPYKGKYLYTNEEASSFESYLAMLGDYLADYEMEEYNTQKIIGFVGSSHYKIVSNTKPEQNNNAKLNSNVETIEDENTGNNENLYKSSLKDYIDIENIKLKNSFKTGIFVSYNVYPSYSNIKEYEDDMQSYFEQINGYHKIPVVIGEFGVPSSRTVGDFNSSNEKGYITEEEQGQALVSAYNAIENSGCAGSFIFEFTDGWHNSSFNTKDSKILDRTPYWSDAQTYGQNFGLMAFDPGEGKSVSYPDSSIDEWSDKDILSNNDDYSLSMKSDEKYLYFMIKSKNNINLENQDIYVDLDITPKSGSSISSQFNLEFDSPIDFIIKVNNKNDASVLVHEYYNRFSFYENKSQNLKRPDLMSHTKDMDNFSPIYIEARPKMYIESLNKFAEKLIYETGKLVHGNGNPSNQDYKSTSDYYVGDNYLEIRIPYGILNFMDPSTKAIQDDFYEVLDTVPIAINDIKVGVTVKENNENTSRLTSRPYDLDGWIMPTYHERLKKSYFVIKEELNKN